jgi:hypothetical protein
VSVLVMLCMCLVFMAFYMSNEGLFIAMKIKINYTFYMDAMHFCCFVLKMGGSPFHSRLLASLLLS